MKVALPPQKFREIVLQLLFSLDVHASDPEELYAFVMKEMKVGRKPVKEAAQKVEIIRAHLTQIDAAISAICTSYDFHRIQLVERSILRLAVFEHLYDRKLAHPIIIAEAKRLAKKFSTPEAALFCQAILDNLFKSEEIKSA